MEDLLKSLDLDDLCGQLLCYDVSPKDDIDEVEKRFKKMRPGGIFVSNLTHEQIKQYSEIANKYTKIPVIVSADIESGPGSAIVGERMLPHHMACGACDDPELVERAAEEAAKICRLNGIHWTLSPMVDINMNPNNPVVNIRAISDSTNQVIRIGGAMLRGFQKNGYMVCSCKSFPGDGVDDRNQHFCTTINSLSFDDWMSTFGAVYKAMIDQGTASIMAAHVALPSYDSEPDSIIGNKPAVLSYKLMTELLKGKLGFNGCIISDAMSMIGVCAMVDLNSLPIEFINAGGDMILFPEDGDFDRIKSAVERGQISRERLEDAVRRILVMKQRARLFEDQNSLIDEICPQGFDEFADKIGEKSISIIRNAKGIIPLKLKPGAKVLSITLQKREQAQYTYVRGLDEIERQLKRRGFETKVLVNPSHTLVHSMINDYDAVLINCKMSSQDYPGGSLRAGWDQMLTLWRGYALAHPKVVFTSFGDPYKLYEFPYMQTYVNAYSYSESTQRGFVKVLLGEIEPQAKSPVALPGFFNREVE